jgi:hypothetical protein
MVGALDNCFFKAQCEDGNLIPVSRNISGCYHVDGAVQCAPPDSTKQMFLQILGVCRAFPGYYTAICTPFPRYLWSACCSDPEHAVNIRDPDHVDEMMKNLSNTQRQWRGILFREKIPMAKVINPGMAVRDAIWWTPEDPVHPTAAAYGAIADRILVGFRKLQEEDAQSGGEEPQSGPGSSKRAREGDVDTIGSIKRSSWLVCNDSYVTRTWLPRGGYRGRGGQGGGGGRGGWTGGNRYPGQYYLAGSLAGTRIQY